MPQASPELCAKWNGPDDRTAMAFLRAAGYVLNDDWSWTPPANHAPTEMERSAAEFMIQEWDFDGIRGI